MANKKLKNSLKKFSGQKEEKLITITGELGIPLGGQKIVDVPNRNGFVYVRLKSNTSEVIQAYNSEVSTIYGLPVLVARQGNIYKVIGRNLDRYRDWSDIPYLPKHGGQHSFNFALGMGTDVTWVYSQQFMPLLSYPSGTQGSMTLSLEPHFYEWQGQWRYAQNTGTPSYTPYLPTITGSARMVLSYLDPSDNSIKLVAGTPFSNTITGSAQLAQYIPDIPRSVGIPLAAVRLVTGTTAIGWGNIYDIRDFYTVSPSITGSTFGGIAVQDEGIPLGTGTVFNFVGTNIDATISGSVVRVFVTGTAGTANPPITGSVVYQGNYVTKGSALVFNFRTGLLASASGTNAQIDVEFGTGTNQVPRGNHNHTNDNGGTIAYSSLSGRPTAETNANDIFRCDSPGGTSAWTGTFTAAGSSGSTIKYATTSGTAASMKPTSTSQLAKMRLYNTTRGNSVLISDWVAGTITSTANYPANWADGDVLTIVSQTVSGGSTDWVDLEITSGPTGKSYMFLSVFINSATAGNLIRLHPFETFGTSKIKTIAAHAVSITNESNRLLKITSNVFCFAWTGTPVAVGVREEGYLE